jgi:hypothetical protein
MENRSSLCLTAKGRVEWGIISNGNGERQGWIRNGKRERPWSWLACGLQGRDP